MAIEKSGKKKKYKTDIVFHSPDNVENIKISQKI